MGDIGEKFDFGVRSLFFLFITLPFDPCALFLEIVGAEQPEYRQAADPEKQYVESDGPP